MVEEGMRMGVEAALESILRLRDSRDFVELAQLGHEFDEGSVYPSADSPIEATFHCRGCGDRMLFRDLAWGLELQPLWVLEEISGGDPREDCHARRRRRLADRRANQVKLLERWKRLGQAPAVRAHVL
jgi:hypothetical protein